MFCRARRFTSVTSDLSPATYNLSTSNEPKACRVPFNCSAPALALADYNVPAPCTYNVTFRKRRIQGGASLRFTEPRDTFKRNVSPSPLTYDPDFVYIRHPKKSPQGKICRGKPPRYGSVPSISIPYKYFNGFNIITGDYLEKRPPPEQYTKHIDSTYYNFPFEVNNATLRYKGNQWSKLKSKRKPHFAGDSSSPGVCKYDLLDKPPSKFQKYLDEVRFYNRAKMKSLRTMDLINNRLLTLDEPGPGYYDIDDNVYVEKHVNGTFARSPRMLPPTDKYQSLRKLINLRGIYNVVSHQKKWPPFNSGSSSRPINKYSTLSPAKYLIWNYTLAYKVRKILYPPRVVHPFNSSVERVCDFGSISQSNPEPWAYDIKRYPYKQKVIIFGKKDVLSYVSPMKLSPIWKVCEREVAPWSYEVDSSFYKLSKKTDFHKGEEWQRDKSDRLKWLVDNKSTDAVYMYKDIGARRRGQPIFGGRPVEKELEATPGPADYYIHPLYRESVARALFTFNKSRGRWRPGRQLVERQIDFSWYAIDLPWPHSLLFDLVNELSYG